MIEDLTDLLAEDWAKLGAVKEMGADTERFFRQEMEKTWGAKHLAVFSEEEARKWVLGVSIPNISASCSITSSTSRSVCKVAVRTSTSSSTLDHYLTIPLWFYLQALRLLKVSADLEAKVIALCRESLQCLTVALASSDTKSFWDLMTSYFGSTAKDLEEDGPMGIH